MQTQGQLSEGRKELPSSRPTPPSDSSSSKRTFLALPDTDQEDHATKRRSLSRSQSPDTKTRGQKVKDTNLNTDPKFYINLSKKGREAQMAKKENNPNYKMPWEKAQEAREAIKKDDPDYNKKIIKNANEAREKAREAKKKDDPDYNKKIMKIANEAREKKNQIKPEEQTTTLRHALGGKRPSWMTDTTPAPSKRPDASSSTQPPEPSKDTQ